MRTFAIALLVAGLVLALTPAFAQSGEACKTKFDLTGREDFKWYLSDGGAANPTLTACPGEEITITITQKGTAPHNIKVDASNAPPATGVTKEDLEQLYTFTAPASGTAKYICELHAPGMAGTFDFALKSSTHPGGSSETSKTNSTPGIEVVGVAVAVVGAALLASRRRA